MAEPTISIGPFKNDDGTYRVEVFIHGLPNEAIACAYADAIAAMICGEEIKMADGKG